MWFLVFLLFSYSAFGHTDLEVIQESSDFVICEFGKCGEPSVKVLDVKRPIRKIVVKKQKSVVEPIETIVYYELGSSTIDEKYIRGIVGIVEIAKRGDFEFLVEGNTDLLGGKKINRNLAKLRAVSVKNMLNGLGVTDKRITVVSNCCIYPPIVNESARRTVIKLIKR